ncbi:MAG TPA: ribonuclease domain-containing protein [Luteimonas sp.]|nr:ribonuclease domain-containing protein [Luteimonas sp.]HRO28004.1 ribonuclease domain-containing protein [Luteimonas sp.]HRP71017.1 ribonuclease domain-containing protein [Luteimonas sp.]
MKRLPAVSILLVIAVAAALWTSRPSGDAVSPAPAGTQSAPHRADWPTFLPAEARPVLQRIVDGSAHPYRQDGSTFQNREGRLPQQPRGYYREYTVDTPGLNHRGARRIVTGGKPPSVYYYSGDHYGSFRRFEPPPELTP